MVVRLGECPQSGDPASERPLNANPPVRHLNQAELAERLGVSVRTVEGWRYRGKGPDYLRLEGRVAYRLVDVERFEAERLQHCSGESSNGPP
jgi:helix-turn-helix protein